MIKKTIDFVSNMGFRYILFRIYYYIKIKTGVNKIIFPYNPKFISFISLKEWKKDTPPFFFKGKYINNLPKIKSQIINDNYNDIINGIIPFFGKNKIDIGFDYDWITNPLNNYKYDINKHWSEAENLSYNDGDIKFVWEKARFCYIYDIIRYDYHYEVDKSEFVLNEISDFIDKNPINSAPNYICSQEISVRVFNWTFALNYYIDSIHLTENLFNKIINAIYWQIHHIYNNINFSRIAVRNNHAISETLLLYLSNKLFPFIPESKKWSIKGKKWFEEEILYQIYEDGTFLQFSMNYHRVVTQLFTWAIQLSKINNERFNPNVYNRIKKSLEFLDVCMDPISGKLPNYGSNDGALFFKLNDDDYTVYKSQLDDLRAVLYGYSYSKSESFFWYGVKPVLKTNKLQRVCNSFNIGGYYIIQEEDNTKTFVRCGSYKDRPSQSDNLHIDIWVNGNNILRDSGSYKYNTEKQLLEYFNGSEGHNTISYNGNDQMIKGDRFIWHYWVKRAYASLIHKKSNYVFSGKIQTYDNVHERNILKIKNKNIWEIKDSLINTNRNNIFQFWHIPKKISKSIKFKSFDEHNKILSPIIEEKWFSEYYGFKEKSLRYTFSTRTNIIKTIIEVI